MSRRLNAGRESITARAVHVRRRESRLDRTRPTTEQATEPNEPKDHRFLPPKLSHLRQKLGQKAKQEPRFRFYTLYGRILEYGTLWAAWCLVAANEGAPGIDGVTIQQIERGDQQQLPATSGHPDGPRPRGADGNSTDLGADL